MRKLSLGSLLLLLVTTASCKGAMGEKLLEILRGSVILLELADPDVKATCTGGAEVTVPISGLNLNMLGLASPEDLIKVAKQLQLACESVEREKQRAANELATLQKEAEKRKLKKKIDMNDAAALRTAICGQLEEDLPLRGPRRDQQVALNIELFKCPDPGPPKKPATGWWSYVEGTGKDRGAQTIFLETEGETGEIFSIRCAPDPKAKKKGSNKLDVFITVTATIPKTTKNVTFVLSDKKKPVKLDVNLSTDGKAFFVEEPGKKLASLSTLGTATITVPLGKKATHTMLFDIGGIDSALKPLRRPCDL